MRLALFVILLATTHAQADKKCVVPAAPIVVTLPPIKAPPCKRASKAIEGAIAKAIKQEFHPEQGGKPEVTFPCDGLGPRVQEIVLENGNGHGGTLGMYRAKRRADGKYDVRGIVYQGHAMTRTAAPIPHLQVRGVVALPELDKARAAVTAKVREVTPPPKPGGAFGMSGSSSSHDFHVMLRFVDDDGRVVERRYTGYASSSSQNDYLGLQVAELALAPITQLAPDPKLAADQEDRDLFATRFDAAVPFFDQQFNWWVMERYVDLARFLGGPPVIRGLLTRLTVTKPDRSKTDARADALDALANITGWDPRKAGKSVEDAAAAFLAECR